MNIYYMNSENDVVAWGEKLGESLEAGDVIALVGQLGMGKTTVTKAIAKGLGIHQYVKSPTFNIVSEYDSGRLNLYHFDVYRVMDDVEEIGLEEYFNKDGVVVVEWADMIPEMMPENTKWIFIYPGEREGERVYKCTF